MLALEILADPVYKVIFKHTLDQLMEEVWGYQLMDVCMREMLSERLRGW